MLTFGAASLAGRRAHNEDAWLALPTAGLFAVADGMGGLSAGDEASRMAIAAVEDAAPTLMALRGRIADLRKPDATISLSDLMTRVIEQANTQIHALGRRRNRVMGTTLTTGLVAGGSVFVAHVGDSRAYRIRAGRSECLTQDHSVAARRVRQGRLSRDQYGRTSRKNMLYQAVGTNPLVEPDFLEAQLEAGDRLLWCSDGVWEPLGAPELAALTARPDPREAAQAIVDAAYSAGSDDNLTAVVVHVAGSAAGPADWDQALASSPLFAHLAISELRRLAPFLREVMLPTGTDVVVEDSAGDELYLLLDGEVKVTRGGVELTRLQPPKHFGEIALAGGQRRSATVCTTAPTRMLVLERTAIDDLIHRHPDVGARLVMKLLEQLATRLVSVTDRLVAATGGDALR